MLKLLVKSKIFLFILSLGLLILASLSLLSLNIEKDIDRGKELAGALASEGSDSSFKSGSDLNYHYSEPRDREFFESTYQFKSDEFDLENSPVLAGIIPHHLVAGDLIANFFANLEGEDYETVVLIGPNHFSSGKAQAISSNWGYKTPYGILEADIATISAMESDGLLALENEALIGEHAINSEVSYIKKTFPQAKLLPLILRHSYTKEEAKDLANYLYKLKSEKNILVLASTDFSHYKTSDLAQVDDAYSLEVLGNMDLDNIYKIEVDSRATIYTIALYSQLNEASFKLQRNTNSALLAGRDDIESTTSYITGYFIK